MQTRLIILYLLFPILASSQARIEGFILDKIKETALPNSRVALFQFQRDSLVVVDSSEFHPWRETFYDSIYKKLSSVFTDSIGYYQFNNLGPGVYKVNAAGLMKKTERGTYFEEFNSIILSIRDCDFNIKANINLSVFCPYDSTRNLSNCPKCNKADELRIFANGIPAYPPNYDKYIYTGDCSPPRCRPTKYCLRCEHEF